jgi:DNA polymerase I
MAEERGLEVVAPVHDAIMIEADASHADDATAALDKVMRDAAAVVLRGYELPSDKQVVHAGQSFFDKNGASMWETISRLVAKFDTRKENVL